MKKEKNIGEGLRYPPIDALLDKSKSKYVLVLGAAKRAKDLEHGDAEELLEDPVNKKSLGLALEEIYEDQITIYDSTNEETLSE